MKRLNFEILEERSVLSAVSLVANPNGDTEDADPSRLIHLGDKIVYLAIDQTQTATLYEFDPSSNESTALQAFEQNPQYEACDEIMSVGDLAVLFKGHPQTGNKTAWVTDGTSEGTSQLVADEFDVRFSCRPETLPVVNGVVYFHAHNSTPLMSLWRTDGTSEGTYPIKSEGLSNETTRFPFLLVSVMSFSRVQQSNGASRRKRQRCFPCIGKRAKLSR